MVLVNSDLLDLLLSVSIVTKARRKVKTRAKVRATTKTMLKIEVAAAVELVGGVMVCVSMKMIDLSPVLVVVMR